MAAEDIGALYNTKIPGYEDPADIQAALKLYHYGSTSYDVENTDPTQLPNPSIARHLQAIRDDITELEGIGIGSSFIATEPSGIPDGYIWMDADSVVDNYETYATAVYSNEAPTTGLVNGLIWIDKDSAYKDAYVYNDATETWDLISNYPDVESNLDAHEILNIMGVY